MNGSLRTISIDAIRDAASAVYGAAIRTPLVRVDMPGIGSELQLYLKLEVLQPIGSFKIRGAFNVVRQLTPDELSDGVWTVSADTVHITWTDGFSGVRLWFASSDSGLAGRAEFQTRLQPR